VCVSIDSCKKSAVVFDEAIASFDIINCQSIQAQVSLCCHHSTITSYNNICRYQMCTLVL